MPRQAPLPYPRDKNQLLRDLTLAGQLKDIRDAERLRDQLRPRWWEALVGLLQFVAALGLLASVIVRDGIGGGDATQRMIIFWLALLVLSMVFGFELLIVRLHHLRRANQISSRLIEDLRRRVQRLEAAAEGGKDARD